MDETDKKSIIELAASYMNTDDIIHAINAIYGHIPPNEKGSFFENVGLFRTSHHTLITH